MTRTILAAAILITVLVGGFVIGALGAIVDDTGVDW